jgi:hypothetical protein
MAAVDPILKLGLQQSSSTVLREHVAGSVEVKYRGFNRLMAQDVVQLCGSAWYVDWVDGGFILTVGNGAAIPEQAEIQITGDVNARGTLEIQNATSANLTGKYVAELLSDARNHGVLLSPTGFAILRLNKSMQQLRGAKPELFLRGNRRSRRAQLPRAAGKRKSKIGRRR